jgi:hypothetical protein
MVPLLAFLEQYGPALAAGVLVAVFLAMFVVWVSHYGQRLNKHTEWLSTLDQRVENLHKERATAYVRSLQILPPPLSEAKTTEISEAMLLTLTLKTRKGTDNGEPDKR